MPPAEPNAVEIKRLRKILAELGRVPAHRRNEECADERSRDIIAMLKDLGDDCRDVKLVEYLLPSLDDPQN
jgi:hypothetical protein